MIAPLPRTLTVAEALNLAAWLVAVAETIDPDAQERLVNIIDQIQYS